MTNPVGIQPQKQFEFDDFVQISGSSKSTGYVGIDEKSGDLQKVGAHRTLTFKNQAELSKLKNASQDENNKYIRLQFFQAIKSKLASNSNRLDVLKVAAARLGIALQIENNDIAGEEVFETKPLSRRVMRNLITLATSEERQELAKTPDLNASETNQERDKFIDLMKKNINGIPWEKVPLGSMSLASLREMGQLIIAGQIKTSRQLDKFCQAVQKREQINETSALNQLKQMHGMEPNEVKSLVTLPTDKALPQNDIKAPEMKNEEGVEQGGEVKDEKAAVPDDPLKDVASEKEIDEKGNFTKTLSFAAMMGKTAVLEKLTGNLISDIIQGAAQDGVKGLQDALMNNRRALTVLLCISDKTFSEVMQSVPGGALVKTQFESMRKEAGPLSNGLTSAAVHNQLTEQLSQPDAGMLETFSNITEAVQQELHTDTAQKIASKMQSQPNAVKDFRAALTKVFNESKDSGPNQCIEKLLSTLKDNADMLSVVLCETDKYVSDLGGEKYLRPMLEGLKQTVNNQLNADLGLEGNAKMDFFKPEFEGRVADEIQAKLEGFLKTGDFVKALAPSALNKPETVAKTVMSLVEHLLDASGRSADIDEAQKSLSNVTDQDVRNMLADMILERETWISDKEGNPGERMKSMLTKHLDTAAVLLCNVEKFAKEMALPDMVLDAIKELKKTVEPLGALFAKGNEGFAKLALKNTLESMGLEEFALVQKAVDSVVMAAMEKVQDVATVAFESMLKGENIGDLTDLINAKENEREYEAKLTKLPSEQIARKEAAFTKFVDTCIEKNLLKHENKAGLLEIYKQRLNALKPDEAQVKALMADYRSELSYQHELDGLTGDERTEFVKRHGEDQLHADMKALFAELKSDPTFGNALTSLFLDQKVDGYEQPDPLESLEMGIDNAHKDQLKERFDADLGSKSLKDGFNDWAKSKFYTRETRDAMLKYLAEKKHVDINQTFAQYCGEVAIDAKMDETFKTPGFPLKQFKDPATMSPEELEIHRLKEGTLDELAGSGVLDLEKGYGKFMVEVMKRYFGEIDLVDKRSMMSSLLRHGVLQPVPDDATAEQRAQVEKNNIASLLGSLFKGAGPIMQKLLQQLGSMPLPENFKAALEDMKCNLLPIPDEMVRAQLLDIVQTHNQAIESGKCQGEKITNIEMTKVMGAASVGEAVLCTVTDAQNNKKEVIVKLLRPEAENRMHREEALFLEVAKQVKGMEQTYLGRLERIKEELDFRIEAKNVEKGQIYDAPLTEGKKKHTDVKSMKLVSGFEATKGAMILERAPGTTVSNYMRDSQTKREAFDNFIKDPKVFEASKVEVAEDFAKHIADMRVKQEQLLHLSHKWVEEGLFKNGFYHGDLHSGNIMVDNVKQGGVDKGLTVIDFGNATELTGDDQKHVMRMVYGATTGDAKLFMENYKALMHSDSQAKLTPEIYEKALTHLKEIFSKGSDKETGQRIGAALGELQKLELELPAVIFNFSQCQILLQGAIEQFNHELEECEKAYQSFINQRNVGSYLTNVLMPKHESTIARISAGDKDAINQINLNLQNSRNTIAKMDARKNELETKLKDFPDHAEYKQIEEQNKTSWGRYCRAKEKSPEAKQAYKEYQQSQAQLEKLKKADPTIVQRLEIESELHSIKNDRDLEMLVVEHSEKVLADLGKEDSKIRELNQISQEQSQFAQEAEKFRRTKAQLEIVKSELSVCDDDLTFHEPFYLDSDMEEILGMKSTDEHTVGNVKNILDTKIGALDKKNRSEKENSDLARMKELQATLRDGHYSDRETLKAPLKLIQSPISTTGSGSVLSWSDQERLSLFEGIEGQKTKANVLPHLQKLKTTLQEADKQNQAASEHRTKTVANIKGDWSKFKDSYVQERIKQLPNSLSNQEREAEIQKLNDEFKRFSSLKNLTDEVKDSQIYKDFMKQCGSKYSADFETMGKKDKHVPVLPFYMEHINSAWEMPHNDAADKLAMVNGYLSDLKGYHANDLVLAPTRMPKDIVCQGKTIGEIKTDVTERYEQAKQSFDTNDKRQSDLLTTMRTTPKFSEARSILDHYMGAMDAKPQTKFSKMSISIEEKKGFLQVMGNVVSDHKWDTAKKVGAKATIEAVVDVIKDLF